MLNDKLPVVVAVPARPQAPSLSLVPTFRLVPSSFPSSFNTLFLFRFRFLLLALMKPLFAFRQFPFCCFHFICLYCLGRKRKRANERDGGGCLKNGIRWLITLRASTWAGQSKRAIVMTLSIRPSPNKRVSSIAKNKPNCRRFMADWRLIFTAPSKNNTVVVGNIGMGISRLLYNEKSRLLSPIEI